MTNRATGSTAPPAAPANLTRCLCLLALGGGLLAPAAYAGDWTWTPRLRLTETYTDNVRLAPDDDKEDQFVTRVAPGFSLRGNSARLSSNVDYNMQFILRPGDDENQTNHQLQGRTNATIIRDYLFFDAQSVIAQQLTDARGRISNSNINLDGNRADTISYRFSPFARFRLGDYARAELRYTYFDVSNQSNQASDSASDEYRLSLNSGQFFGTCPWSVIYTRRENTRNTTVDADRDVTFERINGRLSFRPNRKYTVFVTLGEEDNNFRTNRRGGTGGFTWNIGARWTPNPRTNLQADWGERFFGKTFNVNATYRRRRIALQASYREQVRTINQLQENFQPIRLVDEFGNEVFDPEDSADFELQEDSPTQTDDVFVNKRLNGSVAYNGRRARVRLTFSDSTQEFQQGAGNDGQTRIRLNVNYPLSQRLRAGFNVSWQENSFDDGLEDTLVRFSPSLNYQFSQLLNTRVSYSYNERSTDDPAREFTENRVNASVSFRF